MVKHRIVASAVVVLAGAALGGSVGVSGPAWADGSAPGCVSRIISDQPEGLIVRLRNGCGMPMRVKVDVSEGAGGPCTMLANGTTNEWRFKSGSYVETVLC
ncbi:hypothetical protein [Nonomuraea insulae]|uniref:Uncharacterized protein n=1 Tax=Nonomuraea insulae TaxID=1616787 RepID=A0ABW1CCB5_9ACTN